MTRAGEFGSGPLRVFNSREHFISAGESTKMSLLGLGEAGWKPNVDGKRQTDPVWGLGLCQRRNL